MKFFELFAARLRIGTHTAHAGMPPMKKGAEAPWKTMVPEARFELARLSTTVFETATSAIPSLGREGTL